ncbi:hypothetical protein ACIRRA_37290 [Nocardia sp. NPDC101769]|uniref:hypothetical protein n=1 Tax=Nocardia sp. NPDC101769 TaxID=3364333 RepID=UPI003815C2E4
MITNILAVAAWAFPAPLWWAARGPAEPAGGLARPTRRRHGRSGVCFAAPTSENGDARFAEFADRGVTWPTSRLVWPALSTENALLSELLAGRLPADRYRERIAELARRCESTQPISGDD